jgi:dinuclear metal center YbgI/SA1388 family protein
MHSVDRDVLVDFLNQWLLISSFKDHSQNGLQVQGSAAIRKVALATDASLKVYEKAVSQGCDMVLTHHGLIWGGLKSVTGRDYRHVKYLLDHNVNLYAVHLPLDAHPDAGNNIVLARLARVCEPVAFGLYHGHTLGFAGELPEPLSLQELSELYRQELGGTHILLPFGKKLIRTVAIVSGGGAESLPEAIEKNFDCFITGEGPHHTYHAALECGINVLYLGHYHSETVGVKAVGKEITKRFKIETVFIDEPPQI